MYDPMSIMFYNTNPGSSCNQFRPHKYAGKIFKNRQLLWNVVWLYSDTQAQEQVLCPLVHLFYWSKIVSVPQSSYQRHQYSKFSPYTLRRRPGAHPWNERTRWETIGFGTECDFKIEDEMRWIGEWGQCLIEKSWFAYYIPYRNVTVWWFCINCCHWL